MITNEEANKAYQDNPYGCYPFTVKVSDDFSHRYTVSDRVLYRHAVNPKNIKTGTIVAFHVGSNMVWVQWDEKNVWEPTIENVNYLELT